MARTGASLGIKHDPLTDNQVEAALLNPVIFIDRHCWIRGKGGKHEPFRVTGDWDFQRQVIETFDDEDRVLILKARQLGISWSADAFALWLCTANHGQTVIILSQGQRESKEEMMRIRFMHARLPPELKRRTGDDVPDAHVPDTTEQLEFPDMDSRIISLPSTEHAGTSFTATLVIIHELAKIQTAANLMTAITPTMADSGKLFVVSTAFGYSGVFYNYWMDHGVRWSPPQVVGTKGEPGDFIPIFIPWYARPGRNEAWYKATQKTFAQPGAGGAKKMKQEYPATPKEAFQGSVEMVFSEEFNRDIHVVQGSRHPESAYEVVNACDMGVSHAFGYLIEVQGNAAFVFAEIHLENDTVENLGKALAAENREWKLNPSDITTYPDPAGVGRNLQTLKTDYDVLEEQGLLIDRETGKVSPAQRVDIIKSLLLTGRFWVSADCPFLIDALEKAQWKMRRIDGEFIREDTYRKDGKHEHPLDAVGYGVSRIFPPMIAAAIDTETPVAVAVGGGGYSGSEFGG